MDAIELARRLAAHGETEAACRAYTLALDGGADPGGQMEAAVYLFQAGGDYRIAYGCFRDLYNQGHFQKECLAIMTQTFYEPNIKSLEKRYKKLQTACEIPLFVPKGLHFFRGFAHPLLPLRQPGLCAILPGRRAVRGLYQF